MAQTKRIALITGGSRGLGKNMALSLARSGVHVVITYLQNKEEAEKVVKEIQDLGVQAAALQLNTANVSSFNNFFTEFQKVLKGTFQAERFDYLINNAGTGIHVPFAQVTEEQFDAMQNIHFKGVFFLTQKALDLLNDGGAIVNLSTGLARFTLPGYSAYAPMKGAIETLTKYLAKELGHRGIRANVLAPGAIETDFSGGVVRDNAELNKMIASQIALGRVGLPDDIGGVAAFLCSDAARWVNAQRLEASGGQNL